MKSSSKTLFLVAALMFLVACGGSRPVAPTEVSTPVPMPIPTEAEPPTNTPQPTRTPEPTRAPESTDVPTPVAMPIPTIAPPATEAPATADTPAPEATAEPTAILQPTIVPPSPEPKPLPPASYNGCQADPNPGAAPDYPVKIAAIDKSAETVTLQNVSGEAISLDGWHMCSIKGNQQHPIGGTIQPGESIVFPGPLATIWSNSDPDDGALYNANDQLVSYWND